jgi:hypothetical protein
MKKITVEFVMQLQFINNKLRKKVHKKRIFFKYFF